MAGPKATITTKVHLNWKYVILFGLWDAAWAILWGAYNNYMPVFWQSGNPEYNVLHASRALGFGLGAFATGLIMSIDNIASLFMTPIFGALSDRARRRKPIVIMTGLLPGIFYALIPVGVLAVPPSASGHLRQLIGPFAMTMIFAGIMIVTWAVAKAAEGGLRYAIIPSAARTKVYSYAALFTGGAFIFTYTTSNLLYKIHPGLPFWLGAGVLLIAVACYALFIKEPEGTTMAAEGDERVNVIQALRQGIRMFSPEQKRALAIVSGTKFLSWWGVAGLETFASSYIVNNLGINEANAGNLTAIYFLGYLLFAVPAGYLANKIGRKNLLRLGLIAFAVAGATQYITQSRSILLYAVLLIAGAANAVADNMCTTMVTDIAPSKKVMGFAVAIFSSVATLASITAVPLWGAIIQALHNDFSVLWLGLAIAPLIGIGLLQLLRGNLGEAKAATAEELHW